MRSASPWIFVFLSLLVVLTPLSAFFVRKVRFRSIDYLDIERRNGSWWSVWRRILSTSAHWIELVRAFVGTLGLRYSLGRLLAHGAHPGRSPTWLIPGIVLGAGLVALVVMLVWFRRTDGAPAPVAFVSAAILTVMPLEAGALALVLALAAMAAFKSLAAFFLVLALGVAGLGFFLGNAVIIAAIGAAFAATPLVLALLMNRQLVIPIRQPRSEPGES